MLAFLQTRAGLYGIAVVAFLALAGSYRVHVSILNGKIDKCEADMAELVAGYEKASRIRQEHALRLVQAARDEERAAWLERYTQEQNAAQRLREAAREAETVAQEWQKRYREAIATDPGCREWSEAPVACPLD